MIKDTAQRTPGAEIFARNILFWGADRQQRLAAGAVLVAGVGGLGCVVAELLVRAGIGQLLLLDRGVIDAPDLNRQALYTLHDIGRPKVEAAREKLTAMTAFTEIVPLNLDIDANLPARLRDYRLDGIADCLDNFPSRFHLETALRDEMFLVHGGVQADYGQVTTIVPGRTMRLKELYAAPGDSAGPLPVAAPVVFCVAGLMAQEVLNNLRHAPQLLNQLLVVELADFSFATIPLAPQPEPGTQRQGCSVLNKLSF